jgi:hypothetical protein
MTFCEAEDTLPHGFHDAILLAIQFDFRNRTGSLELDVMVQKMRKKTRRERLRVVLSGVVAVSMNPPDEVLDADGLLVGSFLTTDKELPGFAAMPSELQRLYGSLYVHEPWNNFIHVAAREVSIEWLTPSGPGLD